jgi:hypothetical protein
MKSHMIRLIALLLFLAVLCIDPVHALPVGAPVRTLDVGGFSLSGVIGYTSVEVEQTDVTSKSFFFKGAYGGSDGVTPYLKLGFADLKLDRDFEGSLDFAFGGGLLLDLVTQESGGGFRVSLDTQVNWVDSSEGSTSSDLFEGQLAILGSTRSGGSNAYAGLAVSFLNLESGGISADDNGKGHIFFGVDYFMDFNFYFNTEVHLFGEDTLAVGVGYLF